MPPLRRFIFLVFLATAAIPSRGECQVVDETPAQDPASPLVHQRKRVLASGDAVFTSPRRIDLVWFHDSRHTFRVVDNGPGGSPRFPSLEEAVKRNGALAGSNGGFFHPDFSPSGLMIATGETWGKFGEGALLSGVILSSGRRNPYLLRRAEYSADKYKPTDLIQSGPFLVDQGVTVKGLSPENSRRRTFVLHDGGDWFALGLSDPFTLAELGRLLARPEFSPLHRIHRALNLDGGSSSGLYFDPGNAAVPIRVEPIKAVRNFVVIVPR